MDERELKRQKRKQSNRESARRSRLRKQYQIVLRTSYCSPYYLQSFPGCSLFFDGKLTLLSIFYSCSVKSNFKKKYRAECEELQHKVEMLSNESRTLRGELQRLSEECEKLASENNSIKEELTRLYGPDAVSKLE
ncbi:G-box binding factor [Orobanche gracilis]